MSATDMFPCKQVLTVAHVGIMEKKMEANTEYQGSLLMELCRSYGRGTSGTWP